MDLDPDTVAHMTADERAEFEALLQEDGQVWRPLPGPQREAFLSPAIILGYGGAAGGGKTDLACGLALTCHQKVGIFRDTGTELTPIIDRIAALRGTRVGYNGQKKEWRFTRPDGVPVLIELDSFPNLGDETKQQGHDRDLIVFDEAANMREVQVRFIMGWLRSTDPDQRKRVLMNFNPPTSAEGRWIINFFAPWLDDKHPNPAQPGELRWFATVNGKDREVPGPRPFVLLAPDDHPTADPEPVYEFDPADFALDDIITPMSRTFIPSRISDNPFLASTGYMRMLQGLEEPLRSQMLKGDFRAGLEDDAYQVIPTEWVEVAMARWRKPDVLPPMDSVGVDVAMGGKDNTVVQRRHGMWFDQPIVHPGRVCFDGPTIAGFIIAAVRDAAPIHLDLFGVGAQPYGHLSRMNLQVYGINFGEPAIGTDTSGRLTFLNLRSYWWWMLREALDPTANNGIALPPSRPLLADLCAPKWRPRGRHVYVEGREDIVARIGRSPDYATAAILALMDTPKWSGDVDIFGNRLDSNKDRREHDPFADLRW